MQKYKTTILLGAGAMIPYGGPTTNDLTQGLLHNSKCKGFFSSIYNWTKGKANFEFLLSSIETLLDWKLVNEDNDSQSLNPSILLEPIYAYKCHPKWKIWDIYKEAVNDIIERIKDYDYYESSYIDKQRTLIDFIVDQKQKSYLKIYSLNYDRIIPRKSTKAGVDFYEGHGNNCYEYDLDKFINHPTTFFNLHGSIYNSYSSGGCVQIYDIPVTLERPYNIRGGNPYENKIFLPIIAGYSKSQRIMSEPFNLGITAFMYDCNSCNRLVIVGYSFEDLHINAILRKFIKLESTEIVIIDKCNDNNFPDRIRKIPYQGFGIPGAQFIGERNALYLDKNPHIHLNLDGFEQYIKDNISL